MLQKGEFVLRKRKELIVYLLIVFIVFIILPIIVFLLVEYLHSEHLVMLFSAISIVLLFVLCFVLGKITSLKQKLIQLEKQLFNTSSDICIIETISKYKNDLSILLNENSSEGKDLILHRIDEEFDSIKCTILKRVRICTKSISVSEYDKSEKAMSFYDEHTLHNEAIVLCKELMKENEWFNPKIDEISELCFETIYLNARRYLQDEKTNYNYSYNYSKYHKEDFYRDSNYLLEALCEYYKKC